MTDSLPRVVYAVPLLNEVHYVREAIGSLLDQTYPSFDVRVIDAGSTDGTLDVLREMGVDVEIVPRLGQMAAINRVWRDTDAELVGWWAGDDLMYPGAIEAMVAGFVGDPGAGVVYADARFIDASGRVIGEHKTPRMGLPELLHQFRLMSQSTLIRRDALSRSGMMDESRRLAADWDLFLRLAQYERFTYVPFVATARRMHEESEDHQDGMASGLACFDVVRSFLERGDLTPKQRGLERSAMAAAELSVGWAAVHAGNRREAMTRLARAIASYPPVLWRTHQGPRVLGRLLLPRFADHWSVSARYGRATRGTDR
jgi:glycosyltransferase involved in cell wall biosynthesis